MYVIYDNKRLKKNKHTVRSGNCGISFLDHNLTGPNLTFVQAEINIYLCTKEVMKSLNQVAINT